MSVRSREPEPISLHGPLSETRLADGPAAVADGGSTDAPPRDLGAGAALHELRILQALRRITRALELRSRDLMANHSVTGPQLACLLAVKEHGPLTPTAIANEIHLSTSTVVGILDRLEEKGLVHRERDRVDRRQVKLAATAKGLAFAARAPSPLQETLATALTLLPELERIAIALSLERVAVLMETHDFATVPARGASTRQRKSGGAPRESKEEAE
jgi:DNA-binding MarR family transcriptional regulator